jgi:RHS repeat-associated protein
MGKVTAYFLDTITEKSAHSQIGLAVSVCLTPAAPAPLPIPYPTFGNTVEGITDPCMRTKIEGSKILTVGGCMSKCHGNEPGTLREIVSLNITGPCFPWLGAPLILIELGMAGITGSLGQMNKSPTFGGGANASGAGGAGGPGGSPGGPGQGGPNSGGPSGPGNGGGDGGGSNSGASSPNAPAPPGAEGQAAAGHPIDVVTGTMYTPEHVDFTLPGYMWVRFKRSYRTSAVHQRIGLGWGWSHSLAWRGERNGRRFTLVDDGHTETTFELPASNELGLLPYGRKVRADGDAIIVDLNDGLLRVMSAAEGSNRYFLSELRDEYGNAARITWKDDEITSIVDSVGRRAELQRNGWESTWILKFVDGDGVEHQKTLVSYLVNANGDLAQVTDAGGVITRYEYDENHYMTAEHQPDGITYRFVYGEFFGEKRCIETWGERSNADILAELGSLSEGGYRPKGIFHARVAYGPGRHDSTVTDALGNVRRYGGNDFGLVEKYIDPRGHATIFRYDSLARVISITDGALGVTRRQYDASGRVSVLTMPDGATLRFQFDDATGTRTMVLPGGGRARVRMHKGKVAEHIDESGAKTTAKYDSRGKNTAVLWPDGSQDELEYDAHGNLTCYKMGKGGEFRYTFDLLGQPISLRTPTGAEYRLEYDSRGDLVSFEGPNQQRVEYLPDAMHKVTGVRFAGGGERRNRWVAGALVEQVQADGGRFRMGYDALLRLQWIENPAGERYSIRYDAAGNPIRQQTFAGLAYGYEYDGVDRLSMILQPDENRVMERRDSLGRVIAREFPGGGGPRYAYDNDGRLVNARSGATQVEYGYDEGGRLVREVQSAGGFRFEVKYRHDAEGRIIERKYSSGWAVQTKTEKTGNLLSVDSPIGSETLQVQRDVAGREISRRRRDGLSVDTTRNTFGFPEKIAIKNAQGDVMRERAYAWSAVGPVTDIRDSVAGNRHYDLDVFGRPTAVQGLGADERFQYSAHGTAMPEGQNWWLGAGGRPTRVGDVALYWDRRGRLSERHAPDPMRTWRYVYDDEDQLTEAVRGDGLRIQYLYDAFGRRMAETIQGATTWFGWDGNSPVEEQTTTGQRVLRVFAEDGYTPLLEGRDGEGFKLIATDGAATPFLYLGKEGETAEVELSAWGEVVRANGDVGALRFAGQRADAATGLHYNRNRYYAPDLHVYLTPDPLGMEGSVQDVGFVPNTTYYIDPLGLLTIITASNDPGLNNDYYVNYPTQYPGARILRPDQVTPGSLAGETQVMIDTHGAPGSIEWGGNYINGTELGDRLNAAGFNGRAPGARVDVVACNSATSPRGGPSVAQAVANRTGATSSGGQALFNSSWLGNRGYSGLVSGMPSGTPPTGLRVNGLGRWRSDIQPQPGNP